MFDLGQMFTPSNSDGSGMVGNSNSTPVKKKPVAPVVKKSGVGKKKTPTLYGGKRTKDEATSAKQLLGQ